MAEVIPFPRMKRQPLAHVWEGGNMINGVWFPIVHNLHRCKKCGIVATKDNIDSTCFPSPKNMDTSGDYGTPPRRAY